MHYFQDYVKFSPFLLWSVTRLPEPEGASSVEAIDLRFEDSVNDNLLNHILWRTIKGSEPYPGARRISLLELARTK